MEEIPFIRNSKIICNKNNPFEGDQLERASQIRNLTRIIESASDPMVISINGAWGSGKTTFIEMWKCFLECFDKPYVTLYFNAWENDFSKEPFVSLVAEIKQQILDLRKGEEGTIHIKTEEFIKQSSALLLKSLPSIVKLITNGILDIDALKNINSSSKDSMSEVLSKFTESLIKEKTLQKEFRNALEELANSFPHNKIIFFIDELDRCRPTYAVELLENIKHFFNVKGMVFVIAMDKEQLGYSLQTLYGSQMDTEGYLRRFIDLNYNLQTAYYDNFINNLPQFKGVMSYQNNVNHLTLNYNIFKENISKYIRAFNFTLRDLEHLFTQVNIAIRMINPQNLIQLELVPFLLVLKNQNNRMYNKFISKNIEVFDLLDELLKDNKFANFMVYKINKTDLEIPLYIIKSLNPQNSIELNNAILNSKDEYDSDRIKMHYQELIKNYKHNQYLEEIIQIIEFSGNFS